MPVIITPLSLDGSLVVRTQKGWQARTQTVRHAEDTEAPSDQTDKKRERGQQPAIWSLTRPILANLRRRRVSSAFEHEALPCPRPTSPPCRLFLCSAHNLNSGFCVCSFVERPRFFSGSSLGRASSHATFPRRWLSVAWRVARHCLSQPVCLACVRSAEHAVVVGACFSSPGFCASRRVHIASLVLPSTYYLPTLERECRATPGRASLSN